MRHDRPVCVTRRELDEPDDHECADRRHERVRRQREEDTRLADAAQVDDDDQQQARERHGDLVVHE